MSAKSTSIEQLAQAVAGARGTRMCVQAPAWADTDSVLLDVARRLQQRGRTVVVACASEAGAQRLSATVSADAAEPVRITTVGDLALETLGDPRVQAQVKRTNRVLDANEMDILVEDVKVTGLKPRRLREMLKFFYRSISDGTAEKEGWMVSQEEAMVYAVLEENLEARRACMPCEPAAKAWQGLIAANIEPCDQVIIAEDYGAMSTTSQRLLRYLSNDNLIAFGSTQLFETDAEPYPNPAGLGAYAQEDGVEAFELDAPRKLEHAIVSGSTPHGEFKAVGEKTADLVSAGMASSAILIAVPNSTWGCYIHKELEGRHISSWVDAGASKAKGDPRESERCGAIKLAAFAKLLRDPDDFTALRTFVGAGDWLCASDGFLELLAFARDHNVEAPQAMQMMRAPEYADKVTVSFKKMLAPLDEYDELRALWKNGTAGQVRAAMREHGMPLGAAGDLLGADDEAPDVPAFLDRFFSEERQQPANAVTIAPYERCHGHRARVLVMSGMVDGFMPKRDAVDDAFTIDHRKQAIERDRTKLEGIEECASEQVVYTSFDHDALENAAALHMVTTRIYHAHGRRMARIAPSTLLA